MNIRTWSVAAAALVATVGATVFADPAADQVRQARDKAVPSTVVVTFYVERDDGAKADVRTMGTVVGPDNLILMAAAAIPNQFSLEQLHEFKVVVAQGDDLATFDAEYLGKDEQAQAAFLRVTDAKAPRLPVLEFDARAVLQVGDPVITLASLGEPDRYERLIQLTRVAARLDQPVTLYLASDSLGTPGTPVLTLDGRAVGVVAFARLNRASNARPNWTVTAVIWPAARFLDRLKDPPKGGTSVKRAWLGVQTLSAVTKDLAEYYKLGDRRGVVIGRTIEGGPADTGGLKAEDIILAVNGKAVTGSEGQLVENFTSDLKDRRVGEELALDVWRGGKVEKIKVTLTEQPAGPAEAPRYRQAQVGLTVREMVLLDRVARELPAAEKGVVVSFVDPAGWAQDGGLKENDIIKKVQDHEVADLEAFRKLFEAEVARKPKEIVLFVLRGRNETQLVRIEPRWDTEKPKPAEPAAAP